MVTREVPEGGQEHLNESVSLADLLRPLGSRSESVRPFMPVLGGPRLYLLLLYAAVIIGSSAEFFMSQELWYGGFEVYNTYVFVVSGFFILIGLAMLYMTTGIAADDMPRLPLSKDTFWYLGLIIMVVAAATLAFAGADIGGWAMLVSVLVVAGFVMTVMGMKSISSKDSLWLAVFGFGMVMMVLMPAHEVFDVARSDPGDYPFTGLNVALLGIGMTSALLSLHFMRTRDGYLGAWLIGVMALFLLSFHEQVEIVPTGNYEPYDRALALVGVVFSFIPLFLYLWKEKEYLSMWTKMRRATHLMHSGDYPAALVHADSAVQESSEAGLAHKFSLPWNVKGDVLYRMKEYSKAKTSYDMALEIDPEDSTTWIHLGNMYAFEGKRALALSSYDRAIQADARNANAWNNKGAVFSTLDWPEEALACFNRAVALDPKNFDAFMNLAKTYVKLGRSDDAVLNFQKALELRPRSRLAREGLQREFYKGMCMDQIRGWEELGLDTTYLRSLLKEDPAEFDQRSKEFLSSIVEQRTQLVIGGGQDKFDVNAALKAVLAVTAEKGATLERIMDDTGLTSEQLVLPMALLMKTDRLHFKRSGMHDMYVSKGKAPEKPDIPPPPPPEPTVAPEAAPPVQAPTVAPASGSAPQVGEPPSEPKRERQAEGPPKKKPEPTPRREKRVDEELEPTASVLMFGRRPKKEKKRRR
jgi:tetratricopeptide (TPR) repeat protein